MIKYNKEMSFFKKMCSWFVAEEPLTRDEKINIVLNQNLIDLKVMYRNARMNKFNSREMQSNRYLNELVKIRWLEECKLAATESYIGVYFKNKLISSDLDKFNKFLISIFGENIKIRSCCNISIIWGTNDDEVCEANFGHGCGKYAALKLLKIREPIVDVKVDRGNHNSVYDIGEGIVGLKEREFEENEGIVI